MFRNYFNVCFKNNNNSFKSKILANNLCVQNLQLKNGKEKNQIKSQATFNDPEWKTALPYKKIPGPSKLNHILYFLPGGRYYGIELLELQSMLRKDYGDIVKLPGLFRRRDILFIFDPNDFSKVFRTEGTWPIRRAMDTFVYFRKVIRPDIFKDMGGLITEQNERWGKVRSITNPVMLPPKIVNLYIPGVDAIAKEFLQKIYKIRDINNEVPADFNVSVNAWALESIAFIALDTRLGVLNDHNTNEDANLLIHSLRDFFEQSYRLEVEPSMWLYLKTPLFRKQMKTIKNLTEIVHRYVDKAIEHFNNNPANVNNQKEKSVLQKLLQIDPHIAMVMANDMLISGVDTTGATFISTLFLLSKNQDKQAKLREEIMTILPEKYSTFTVENSRNLPYLRACIKEVLRMLPIAPGNMRASGYNIVLKGYQIPKGIDIAMAEYLHHHSDNMFPNAKEFIPERWLNNVNIDGCRSARTAHPYAYLPFGFGVRSCVGRRFAKMELEIILSKIIRNFIVEWHYPDIKYKANMIIAPTGDLKFRFNEINE